MRKSRRKQKEQLDVDITSLLDILVILLVFLLKSYNPDALKIDLASNIRLPASTSKAKANRILTIQIDKNKDIWHDNKKIGGIHNSNEKLIELFKEHKSGKPVNIVLDNTLTYTTMDKVMNLCAQNGANEFNFIVKSEIN